MDADGACRRRTGRKKRAFFPLPSALARPFQLRPRGHSIRTRFIWVDEELRHTNLPAAVGRRVDWDGDGRRWVDDGAGRATAGLEPLSVVFVWHFHGTRSAGVKAFNPMAGHYSALTCLCFMVPGFLG